MWHVEWLSVGWTFPLVSASGTGCNLIVGLAQVGIRALYPWSVLAKITGVSLALE
jgi:hypothetical protein